MSQLSTDRLTEMLEIAERAQTGDKPWREGTKNVWDETTNECVAVTYRNRLAKAKQQLLAEYITTFDPSTCVELVREVIELRKAVTDVPIKHWDAEHVATVENSELDHHE
jgi:hypothetical protein